MKFLLLALLSGHLFGNYPHFEEDEETGMFLTSQTTASALPNISRKIKKMIDPHLLPLDHPAKPLLDVIFSEPKVTKNEESLVNAGFSIITIQSKSSIVVARHPLVPGFVFKIYRDSHPTGRKKIPGWECLVMRCMNAKKVKKIIDKHHLRYFTVPDKWLYLLPTKESPSRKKHQPVILLATDMEIEPHEKTKNAWKTLITHKHLDELYTILNAGYGSYCLINNIPFTKHETFALVDLEKPKRKIDLKKVKKCLSKEMQPYWKSLINEN